MRLKLVVLTSLIAGIFSGAALVGMDRVIDGYWGRLILPELPARSLIDVVLMLGPTILSMIVAAILVYRRTSRLRKTQAALTVFLVLVLAVLTTIPVLWVFPPPPLVY